MRQEGEVFPDLHRIKPDEIWHYLAGTSAIEIMSIFELMDKRQFILSRVKSGISKIDSEAKIILFGSRARNDANKDSDWDFLILTHLPVSRELKNKIYDELFETELETEEVITGLIQSFENWAECADTQIHTNILKDGIEI